MTSSAVALLMVMPMMVLAQERPPQLLQLFHERLKPGVEAAYGRIEEDAARICAQLRCPNPYLALESMTGPKEVWWLNAYASEAHKDSVAQAYEHNTAAMAALREVTERKQGLTYEPEEFFATYRSGVGDESCWRMGGTRFFVMTVTRADRHAGGCVFEAPDGTRFIIATSATRRDATRKAAVASSGAKVFAIRPSWSLPADAWIASDPDFWRASPAAKGR
jgi:hypothetical protein